MCVEKDFFLVFSVFSSLLDYIFELICVITGSRTISQVYDGWMAVIEPVVSLFSAVRH